MRVTGSGGDENMKGTHAHHLEKARTAMFVKLAALQQSLKTNAAFSKFQLQIGGKFPRQDYEQYAIRRLRARQIHADCCSG